MQREIWMADLEPVEKSEQGGTRPVIIISGPSMNAHYPVVFICPLTSKIKPYKGCPLIQPDKVNKLKVASQAIPFQIRTVSKSRLKKKIGIITEDQLDEIKRGLHIYLTY
jgi:mRNA interferase MazF